MTILAAAGELHVEDGSRLHMEVFGPHVMHMQHHLLLHREDQQGQYQCCTHGVSSEVPVNLETFEGAWAFESHLRALEGSGDRGLRPLCRGAGDTVSLLGALSLLLCMHKHLRYCTSMRRSQSMAKYLIQ